MPYKENLTKATALKAELDALRPLTPEMEKRVMQKFRLDWNYHSSHIEGNQLTYGETKALILFGQTAQAKPLKDHLEMTGHDEAVKEIEEVIRQERPLTESFIRELHTLILKEPYDRPAISPEGIPTTRRITIGQYKTTPNHVQTKTGEMFYFASPEETPASMAELMAWYNENLSNSELHPVLFATEFHYRFIRIHPFDDGNGRIARLLMNFILMQKGYPPAIIKTEEKEDYYAALQQADAGQIEFFFNYLCIQVIRSLDLMVKAAKGEEIDDADDLDKKLALLKQKLNGVSEEEEVKLKFSGDTLKQMYDMWLRKLIEGFIVTTQKFNDFYVENSHLISFVTMQQSRLFKNNSLPEILDSIDELVKVARYPANSEIERVNLLARFKTFRKAGVNAFDCDIDIEIVISSIDYFIDFDGHKTKHYLLHVPLTELEISNLIKLYGDKLYKKIEENLRKV